jgi:hypothetical protein
MPLKDTFGFGAGGLYRDGKYYEYYASLRNASTAV